jgi:hypothetical protein
MIKGRGKSDSDFLIQTCEGWVIEEIGFILHVMSYITQVFGLKWLLLLFGVRER